MLYVQSFYSVREIDHEFVTTLDGLLASHASSFGALEDFERLEDKNTALLYHLFFGPEHNRPIGLLLVRLIPVDKDFYLMKKERLLKFWQGSDKAYWLQAQLPTITKEACVFESKYTQEGQKYALEILQTIREKRNVVATSWNSKSLTTILDNTNYYQDQNFIHCYSFNGENLQYENYVKSLNDNLKQTIRDQWKMLYTNPEFNLGEKKLDAHETKTLLNKLLKQTPISDIPFLPAINRDVWCLSINYEENSVGICYLTRGHQGNYFLYFPSDVELGIGPILLLQYAFMRFMEMEDRKELWIPAKWPNQLWPVEESLALNLKPQTTHFHLHSNYNLPDETLEKCWDKHLA
ncbi:MAG: hypothetical protein ACOCUH_02055 [Bacteriovoracia bacterium]